MLYFRFTLSCRSPAILREAFLPYVHACFTLEIWLSNFAERFMQSTFSFGDGFEKIKTAVVTQRDEIERLRGMIDGQRRFSGQAVSRIIS